jgi:hypothetical protein
MSEERMRARLFLKWIAVRQMLQRIHLSCVFINWTSRPLNWSVRWAAPKIYLEVFGVKTNSPATHLGYLVWW